MSGLASLKSHLRVAENIPVADAATAPPAPAECDLLLADVVDLPARLLAEEHAPTGYFRTAGTGPLRPLIQLPVSRSIVVAELELPLPLRHGLVLSNVVHPGSGTGLAAVREAWALAHPANVTWQEPSTLGASLISAVLGGVLEQEPREREEELELLDSDPGIRLTSPPIAFRPMTVTLQSIGKEAPRIGYDPDRE